MERRKKSSEEIQEQHTGNRQICSLCARKWYSSVIGPCPEREGRKVCMYCCRMCQHSYLSRLGGWGCRRKDQERETEKKRKAAERIATPPSETRNRRV